MTADQVLAALWRRKLLIAAIVASALAIGAAVVMAQPSTWSASVVVRSEPQNTHPELVEPTVLDDVERRLVTARQELLARPLLERVIAELNLYPEIVSKRGMERAVEKMRGDVTVKLEGDSAFELTYEGRDPALVAKVANRLPELYAELAVDRRKAQAERATGLFADEVVALKGQLAEWERQIARFKVEHIGELPEQLEQNMRGLETLGALTRVKSEELRVAEGRRSDLARARNAIDSEAGRLEAAESGLTRALETARSTWTPDHPEVQRLEAELTAIHDKRVDAEARMHAERAERSRAAALTVSIREEMDALKRQAEVYERRLDHTPRWAHELGVMARDYDIARTKYQSVISRKIEAEIAQELEIRGAKSQFAVISPAHVPTEAAKPDRASGLLVAFVVALTLGLMVGVVVDLRDDSIRDGLELKRRLPLPLLAVVPQMGAGRGTKRVLAPARPPQPPGNTTAH